MTRDETRLTDRAQLLLKLLVQRYIRDGQPVGSRAIAEEMGNHLSSATIRNVLAELEECGLLHSPHTSAGRIPTAAGYRLFVNHLLHIPDPCSTQIQKLQEHLSPEMEMTDLLQFSSSLLSDLTHLVGLVTLPAKDQLILRHIEFVPLANTRVLVILVLNDREVQNRILHLEHAFSVEQLQYFANYLNQTYAGMELKTAQHALKEAILQDREHLDQMLHAAINLANRVFTSLQNEQDLVIAGQNNLLYLADQEQNLETLRELFHVFKQKEDMLELLNKCLDSEGVQIFIGEESGYEALGDYSVVGASYSMDGHVLGMLGVIGPTRMPYDRVISIVDVTAKLLTSALNHAESSPYS